MIKRNNNMNTKRLYTHQNQEKMGYADSQGRFWIVADSEWSTDTMLFAVLAEFRPESWLEHEMHPAEDWPFVVDAIEKGQHVGGVVFSAHVLGHQVEVTGYHRGVGNI